MTETSRIAQALRLGGVAAFLALAATAHAKSLYVSSYGNDGVTWTNNNNLNPWKTITQAGKLARAGDTVYVWTGTYTQPLVVANSGTAAARITFKTWTGKKDVVIKKYAVQINGKNHITIRDFIIQDVYITDPSGPGDTIGIGVAGPSTGVIISGNTIKNTTGSAIAAWGIDDAGRTATYDYKGVKDLIIENNTISDAVVNGWNEAITIANGVDNFQIRNNTLTRSASITNTNGGEAIDVKEGASNGYIYGNTITQYHGNMLYLDAGGHTGHYTASNPPKLTNIHIYNNNWYQNDLCACQAIMLASEGHGAMDGIYIYNNRIRDTGANGILVYAHPNMPIDSKISNVYITNNSIYDSAKVNVWSSDVSVATSNSTDVLKNFGNIVVRNNASFRSGTAYPRRGIWIDSVEKGYAVASNNSDPTINDDYNAPTNPFVNAPAGDFRLYAGSPAVDKGAPVGTPGVPSFDATNVARPKGLGVDIGAHESF